MSATIKTSSAGWIKFPHKKISMSVTKFSFSPGEKAGMGGKKASLNFTLGIFLAVGITLNISLQAQPYIPPDLPNIPDKVFNINLYGAVGDGVTTNNAAAIQSAIDAASKAGGGIVEIPAGVYLSGPFRMASQINLRLDEGALLRMLPIDEYPGGTRNPETFIGGNRLHDVAISGSGGIDGQGIPWWPFAREKGARRPVMIRLSACDRVLIENVHLTNSPMFHIAINGKSSNVTVRSVTIRANPSTDPVNPGHNTDACDVSGRHVLIENCDVSVGDDNFTCGGNTSDVLITNCTYGYGHGVSIGSPTRGGVSNITVINCTFNNTEQGIRIKTDRDRGGFLHNLSYYNLHMTNVEFPILIYESYMATNRAYRGLAKVTAEIAATYPSAPITGTTPYYRDITFSNITATVAPGNRAGLIWGLPEAAVTNIVLDHVDIKADRPFGIYDAQNVRVIDSHIVTPEGVNKFSTTNAQITITP
jgi:polygalacturonase